VPSPHDGLALALGVGLALAVGAALAASPAVRSRLRARQGWLAWGGAWYAAGTLALVPIFPLWQPNRVHFGSMGFGVAAAAAAEAAHPAIAGVLVLSRVALLSIAPPAAATIAEEAPQTGAFMDFARLSRLERFMAETRRELHARYPTAAHHAHVVEMNLPRGLLYALGGDRAVQVWYRDTTLAMVNFTRVDEDTTLAMIAGVQYQPRPRSGAQVVVLSPDAMRAQDLAYRRIEQSEWEASLIALDRADSLTPDPRYEVFHGNNAGYRAFSELQLHRTAEAEAEARRALSIEHVDRNALRTLALALAIEGRLDEALAQVDHLLRIDPHDALAIAQRANIVAARDAARRN